MPVDVQLIRDGRVTLSTFIAPLDIREIAQANIDTAEEILSKATRPIHVMIDCTQIHRLPSNILSNSMRMTKAMHPMAGEVILVVQNPFIATMANALRRMVASHKVSIFATMDEAWAYVDGILAKEAAG